ncbi:MAG: ImmA/IrrE family metallo-endopeptidase [Bauldia sp.]
MRHRRTEEDLEDFAWKVREKLGVAEQRRPDMLTVIMKLKALHPGFNYRRVPDSELPDVEASFDSGSQVISMRESVFRGSQTQQPRARMTIAHELGHFLLGHEGTRNRSVERSAVERTVRDYKVDEFEARRFGAAFLVPASLVGPEWSPATIAVEFAISLEAATYRRDEIDRLHRRATGQQRPLPNTVVDFLREAERRGYRPRTPFE